MIYAKLSNGALVTYQGMTEDQITAQAIESGLTCIFLTQEQFNAALNSGQ